MDHGEEAIKKKAAKLLKIDESAIREIRIVHRSIDARKKPQLLFSYIVDVMLANSKKEGTVIKKAANQNIRAEGSRPYAYPEHGTAEMKKRPVIIGAGPAGMFAALALSENGCAPILLEQGDAVEERTKRVEDFWKNGDEALDIRSNVQFGEGGAGTFSDGKLNTLVKDTSGRNGKVLSTFVEMGADPSILYDHAPHIGTDVLRDVVKTIRNRMKVFMEPKPFAVGLRIQHPQAQINKNQYGMEDAGKLGAAPYKVTAKTTSSRGVYSFCMCPGGMVVNASSEKGHLAVNGMSNFKRDSGIANSALIVAITPADFPEAGPLGGIAFQRSLEERAFALGGGKIPIQLYGDFAANRPTVALGDVNPVFCGGFSFANLRELMPEALNGAFLEGMEQFGRRIKGFDRADAVLAGIESRTSSPLRICRDESLQSSLKGLYPCGEGAGYAGGITSAAMDGLKVAEEIIKRYAAAE